MGITIDLKRVGVNSVEDLIGDIFAQTENIGDQLNVWYVELANIEHELLQKKSLLSVYEDNLEIKEIEQAQDGEKLKDPRTGKSNIAYRELLKRVNLRQNEEYQKLSQTVEELETQRDQRFRWIAGATAKLEALKIQAMLLQPLLNHGNN